MFTTALPPPSPPQVSYLDLLLVHWPEAWLPGSTVTDYKPDDISIIDTWCAAAVCGAACVLPAAALLRQSLLL